MSNDRIGISNTKLKNNFGFECFSQLRESQPTLRVICWLRVPQPASGASANVESVLLASSASAKSESLSQIIHNATF
ncbi:hypothetical protein G9H61_03140 [Aquirufa ecclesiirivi]|uniref:Uncharacterized protein n=1 Tax=Aquirufa ecclesiirivi TaxID=2715124 RepID=A0ABT4JDS3_9BACT|nr:hypothetical protein [Aquirufa ecclesiirivi]MCZ2474423.1 hypothetical protein [Aquirufa ecclesiirivi]